MASADELILQMQHLAAQAKAMLDGSFQDGFVALPALRSKQETHTVLTQPLDFPPLGRRECKQDCDALAHDPKRAACSQIIEHVRIRLANPIDQHGLMAGAQMQASRPSSGRRNALEGRMAG